MDDSVRAFCKAAGPSVTLIKMERDGHLMEFTYSRDGEKPRCIGVNIDRLSDGETLEDAARGAGLYAKGP